QRGLVHLDLKPSNVLLAADGQPMLLDFHLAQQPLLPDGPSPTWLGGTPAYMSPEQIAAVAAMRDRRSVATPVDGRSDIYSLGVLLNEALGGRNPDSSSSPRQAEKPISPITGNSQITPSLADLIGKCLQPRPQDRYPRAAALGADLRRYLGDLPLVGVRNRSWTAKNMALGTSTISPKRFASRPSPILLLLLICRTWKRVAGPPATGCR